MQWRCNSKVQNSHISRKLSNLLKSTPPVDSPLLASGSCGVKYYLAQTLVRDWCPPPTFLHIQMINPKCRQETSENKQAEIEYEPTNKGSVCDFKFSRSYGKEKGDEINLKYILLRTKYQNIVVSICNEYKMLMRYLAIFLHQVFKICCVFTLPAHCNWDWPLFRC